MGSSGYHRFVETASLQAESEMEGQQNGLEDRVISRGLGFRASSKATLGGTDLPDQSLSITFGQNLIIAMSYPCSLSAVFRRL